jgi:DNA-binding MarR family transcriptional regulator
MVASSASLTTETAARLRLAVARLQRIIRQHAMGGLSLTEGSCLALIDREGPLSLTQIAAREHLSAPTITKIVVRLEARGLIDRGQEPGDRRVSLIAVSRRGQALLDRIRSERTAYLHQRLAELGADQLDDLVKALPVLEDLATEQIARNP